MNVLSPLKKNRGKKITLSRWIIIQYNSSNSMSCYCLLLCKHCFCFHSGYFSHYVHAFSCLYLFCKDDVYRFRNVLPIYDLRSNIYIRTNNKLISTMMNTLMQHSVKLSPLSFPIYRGEKKSQLSTTNFKKMMF